MMKLDLCAAGKQNSAVKQVQEMVVDSLLNFETVKMFACEAAEAQRFDGLTKKLARLQSAPRVMKPARKPPLLQLQRKNSRL